MRYIAFLRGINVGGKSLLKMDQLRVCLTDAGLVSVTTYIQSGNVLFDAATQDKSALTACINDAVRKSFSLDVSTAIFTANEWQHIIAGAPDWWGQDPDWKHNALIPIPPLTPAQVTRELGHLQIAVESLEVGNGVLYQSIAWDAVNRGNTGSKLVGQAVYKQMTIRNYNTATKLAKLLTLE